MHKFLREKPCIQPTVEETQELAAYWRSQAGHPQANAATRRVCLGRAEDWERIGRYLDRLPGALRDLWKVKTKQR